MTGHGSPVPADRGREPSRQVGFADAARRWVGDRGRNRDYVPIRKAADALIGSQHGYVRSPEDTERARLLMQVAAEAKPQRTLYRGMALTDAQVAALEPGARRVESIGSWTTSRKRGLGYAELRTRDQPDARNMVLFEVKGGRGAPVSALSGSSYPAYMAGQEFLSSGLFEVCGVERHKMTPPHMDAYGMNSSMTWPPVRRHPAPRPVTVVKLRQVSPGFDVTGDRASLLPQQERGAC